MKMLLRTKVRGELMCSKEKFYTGETTEYDETNKEIWKNQTNKTQNERERERRKNWP